MFSKIKVASGLLCVLAAFCVFQLVTVGLGFWSLTRTHDDVGDLSNIALKQVDAVNETTQRLMDARINLSRAGTRMVRGGGEPADIVQHAREQLTAADQSFAAFMGAEKTSDENSARAAALAERYKKLHDALTELAQFLDGNNIQAFLDQPTQSFQDAYLVESHNFVQFGKAASRASLDSIDTRMAMFRGVSIAILVLLVVGTAAVYAALRRGVVAPLEEAGRHFDRIAQGRLDQPIASRGTNEIGRLFSGLAKMQASVARTVQTVRESADSIHLGADEIATGNADLSARTENQAASLEETASSMEELTATVRQNADHAREANALAETALEATSRGSEVVNQVVDKMRGIAQSSDKIAEIISVIDGIAFQTNILALNAAVEAARAGEQGRGFAVVAGEVRGLAQRSAQSAKEIKTLISESVAEIQGGSTLVEHAGEAMSNVSASISRVTQMMAEISASSLEQSTGIEQVNQAVVQMDEMTQQNAALVEQAAAAAASLHQQTQQLKQAVSVFEISETVLRTQHFDEMRGQMGEMALSGMRAI
ncbi:methyl-accepting chemotaxis protein [Paraburkholderia sp. BL21I4N1]|uniref:methyl-accepting chemotaxis protein n=1 Tax=Paraburkholderia sp. BL21I4N1 TaxID=1938801 RepID=UPI000CFBF6D1|nr:methyl-accepting chemotaxis protein [Paraburkholderia sp. BL21I4N1]PQV45534.1 methyl-accepting chemotaxis sensory transducer /methyl-accepting chemotaxis sensory transducer with TarH sensor [Paraburkholderia sp. BL21I4N1]